MPEWAERLFHLSLYLAEGWCLQYLFRAFITPRWERLPGSGRAVGVLWVLYQTLCHTSGPDYFSPSLPGLLLYLAVLLLFSLFWYRGPVLLKCFLVLQFAAIHELCVWGGNSLLWLSESLCNLLALAAVREILPLGAFTAAVRAVSIAVILLTGALREALTFFFIRKIVKSFRHRQPLARDVVFYLLPAAAGVLTAALIRLLILTVEDGYAVTLYESYPLLYLILPLIALTLLAADVFSVQTYQSMVASPRERAERVVLENQIVQLQNSIAEMEQTSDRIRAARHDLKNHMIVLQGLARDGSQGELLQYLDSMSADVERLDSRIRTGSPVGDAVINSKFQYAEREIPGIRLDANGFLMLPAAAIQSYDLGVILSNGLDNAIDACKKLRGQDAGAEAYITLRSFRRGRMLFIEIENSFDGVVELDGETGLPRSTKADRELHGIGLKNIRSCAKKYAGEIDCIVEGRSFTLSVMIKGRSKNILSNDQNSVDKQKLLW